MLVSAVLDLSLSLAARRELSQQPVVAVADLSGKTNHLVGVSTPNEFVGES